MNATAPILVTGATGFIGSAVTRKLIESGHETRVLIRDSSDMRNLADLPVERRLGDLTDPDSLGAAMTGCRGVFHVAADYRLWTRDPDAMYTVNVDGTRNLVLAAMAAGVERIVYTSSVATLGVNADHTPADEDTATSLAAMIGDYKRSKFLAEAVVAELIEDQGAPVVIVNPSAPVGPRDRRPTPTGRTILDAAMGRMPAYVDTGLNIVHVDDVAAGHILAFEQGMVGRRYILGGQDMALQDILAEVAALTNHKAPRLRVPHAALLPIAHASEFWANVSGRPPLLTVDGLRLARKHMYFSSQRAEQELGYQRHHSAQQAIADAVDWYRHNGYLSA